MTLTYWLTNVWYDTFWLHQELAIKNTGALTAKFVLNKAEPIEDSGRGNDLEAADEAADGGDAEAGDADVADAGDSAGAEAKEEPEAPNGDAAVDSPADAEGAPAEEGETAEVAAVDDEGNLRETELEDTAVEAEPVFGDLSEMWLCWIHSTWASEVDQKARVGLMIAVNANN